MQSAKFASMLPSQKAAHQPNGLRRFSLRSTLKLGANGAIFPSALLFAFALLYAVVFIPELRTFPPFDMTGFSTQPQSDRLPRGELLPLLYHQNLSHAALHSPPFGIHIASLFTPRTVAIAGVEFGTDMINFAQAGYKVHAIEPGRRYIAALRSKIAANPSWNVQLHPYAATSESNGSLAVKYRNKIVAESVPTRRLDDLVHERLAMLSADVQGGELDILQGASGLLPSNVDSVLVEITGCKPRVKELLRLLDDGYTMFDFVPWGQHASSRGESLRDVQNYALDHGRPGSFDAYYDWFCRKREQYDWLQTDVLAVRRDLVAGVWDRLSRIGDTQCSRVDVQCPLRELLTA